MKARNLIRSIFLSILIAAVALGCSNKRNTSSTRAYHELTSRYNIYYNALETYNQLVEDQLSITSTNWFELLPLHLNEEIPNKTAQGGPFDIVIEKTIKAILDHSITAKPKRDPSKAHSTKYIQWLRQEEFNPYIKNIWLLMGKAFVQNGDYNEALSVFREIQRIYPNDINLITETQIWMLRSYVAQNQMYDARNMIYVLQLRNLSPTLTHLYNQEYANYLIKCGDIEDAIPYLEKIIDKEKIYLQKKRLQFILGQIYIMTNDKEKAVNSFKRIKSLKTPPQLNENASVYMAVVSNSRNKFYSDSIAQLLSHNLQLNHNYHLQSSDTSANNYTVSSIVRDRSYNFQKSSNEKKSEISKLLDELMNELNQLYPESEITQNIVSLVVDSSQVEIVERNITNNYVSPEELKARLEKNEAEALKRSKATAKIKSSRQLEKDREKLRKAKIKEREKELKERERIRKAQLKQREKERQDKIRKQKR